MRNSQANKMSVQSVHTFSALGDSVAQENYLINRKEKGIFALADGFGGIVPGAQASKIACEGVFGYLDKEVGDLEATMPFVLRSYFSLAGNVLFNAVIHANRKILASNQKKEIYERGGASIVAGFIDEDRMALCGVGACSAWLVRESKITRLITPRTYEQLCSPFFEKELSTHFGRKIPLVALGIYEDLEPEIIEFKLKSKDWILLYSDSFSSELEEHILSFYDQNHETGTLPDSYKIEEFFSKFKYEKNTSISILMI